MELIELIYKEWDLISSSPRVIISSSIIFCVGGFLTARYLYSNQIASLKERLKLKEDLISQFERETNSSTPHEAKILIDDLQKRVAALEPTSLTEDQILKMKGVLSQSSHRIAIFTDGGDSRLQGFADQMLKVFADCGWERTSGMVMGPGKRPASGILVTTFGERNNSIAGAIIMKAFSDSGIDFEHESQPDLNLHPSKNTDEALIQLTSKRV